MNLEVFNQVNSLIDQLFGPKCGERLHGKHYCTHTSASVIPEPYLNTASCLHLICHEKGYSTGQ
jgi:hypothetical protein